MLLALAASVGIGSGLWHTLATPWAMILDVVPIALFLVWTLWLYARTVLRMSLPIALASMAAFLGISAYAQGFEEILNGSLAYAPALIALLGLGAYHARQATAGRYALLLGRRRLRHRARLPRPRPRGVLDLPDRHALPLAQLHRTGRLPGDAELDPESRRDHRRAWLRSVNRPGWSVRVPRRLAPLRAREATGPVDRPTPWPFRVDHPATAPGIPRRDCNRRGGLRL